MKKLFQHSRQLRQRRHNAFSLKQAPSAQIQLTLLPDDDMIPLDVSALRQRLADLEYIDSPHHD